MKDYGRNLLVVCSNIEEGFKMFWSKFVFVIVFTFFLSACKEDIHDVDYYTKHQDEARNVLQKCKTGELSDANCTNAKDALTRNKTVKSMFAH